MSLSAPPANLYIIHSIGDGDYGSSSASSGSGGDASGGSGSDSPALINILSNNGGNGGVAKSGNSYR
jgi:hypothetical protein